jgi:hypothetical protein
MEGVVSGGLDTTLGEFTASVTPVLDEFGGFEAPIIGGGGGRGSTITNTFSVGPVEIHAPSGDAQAIRREIDDVFREVFARWNRDISTVIP